MEDLIKRITKESEKKFGPLQPCCNMFESACRCETAKAFAYELKGLCQNCEQPVLKHRVCKCGYYKGEKLTDGWNI